MVTLNVNKGEYELYHLSNDPHETTDVSDEYPDVAAGLRSTIEAWNDSVEDSVARRDYPEGQVQPPDPEPQSWNDMPAYQPYLDVWKERPEFKSWLMR